MNNLLKYFKDLTLHPKNAAELKGLILQLAVQGKLTANWRKENPDVEPASVLLERINAEKAQLIKEKKIKKEKPLPAIRVDEMSYELPEEWEVCRVGDVSTIKGGKRVPKGHQLSDQETPHIYIRVTDMKNGSVLFNKLKYISEEVFELIKQYTISKDDLYITIAGTIGDVGEIPEELDNMNLTENAAKIMFYQIDKLFLKMMLRSTLCQSQFLDKVNQMAQPKLALHRVASTTIPLPPLEEQKAIVEVVNTLFAEVEQLEEQTKQRIQLKTDFVSSALQQLSTGDTVKEWAFLQQHFATFFTELPNIKKLRESILQLAVQGKLTSSFRARNPEFASGSHSAKALLERIKAEKAQLVKEKKIKKEKPLPPIVQDEIPYELPDGWEVCRIGDTSTIKGGKRIPKGYQLSDQETPHIYIRVTDMKNGTVLFNKLKYITEEVFQVIKQYTISKDDLYITIAGTIGDVGEIPDELDNMNLTENAAKIMFYQVDKIFLKTILRSKVCQSQFLDKVNQMAQPKLALHRVASTIIPLPPLAEQKAIVSKVNALMALCDQLEQNIHTQQHQAHQWMQSSLKEVFGGEKEYAESDVEVGMAAESSEKYLRLK